MKTKIEWTDETWNPVRGCTRISEGCRNCYAERVAGRFSQPDRVDEYVDAKTGEHVGISPVRGPQPFHGFALITRSGPRWTGNVALIEDKLTEPLRKRSWKGKRVFVNSMSDLFHEALPDEAIDKIFAVMALCPDVTFQVLTKRADRMRRYFADQQTSNRVGGALGKLFDREKYVTRSPAWYFVDAGIEWAPLPNVWLGVSVEDQETADARIPHLLETPAAVRFVSYEPALGPVNFDPWLGDGSSCANCGFMPYEGMESYLRIQGAGAQCIVCSDALPHKSIDWIIAGGESGPGARPAHPSWFRDARDQCEAAGVPFFFKQWGEWVPVFETTPAVINDDPEISRFKHVVWNPEKGAWDEMNGMWDDGDSWPIAATYQDPEQDMARVGKKAAGRQLDGREHSEFPR